MSMAQGQQAPAAPQQITEEDITNEDLEQSGFPKGDDEKAIKSRIMTMLDKFGVLQSASKQQQANLEKEAAKLAKAIVEKDVQAIEASPLNDIFEKIVDDENAQLEMGEEMPAPTGGPVPQQGGTKDFASMMPPTPGGGMGGR